MAETATTAAVTVFPTTNDVVGGSGYTAAGLGKTLGEDLLAKWRKMPHAGYNYVESGGAYQLVSGRTYRHQASWAMIAGYIVRTAATGETLTCEASTTCYTWLQLVRNASSQVTGARWVVTSTASVPALPTYGVTGDQVMFGYVTANASAITAQGDTYRGIIVPGTRLGFTSLASDSAGSGDKLSLAYVHDGQTPIDLFGHFPIASTGGAGTWYNVKIRNASGGGGTAFVNCETNGYTANCIGLHYPNNIRVDAGFGPVTYYANMNNAAGTPTLYGGAGYGSNGAHMGIRAR